MPDDCSNSRDRRSDRDKPSKADAKKEGINWRGWLIAVLLLGALVFAALNWSDVKKFAQLVQNARPLWLVAAAAAQLATYALLAGQWAIVLKAGECERPPGKLLSLTVAKHFADQMVPTAGMSGNVVVVDRLIAIGASRPIAVAAVILAILAYFGSYAIGALAALLLLWWRGDSNWLAVALISAFLALTAAVPALALWLQKKGKKAIPHWLRNFGPVRELFDMIATAPDKLVRDPTMIAELTALNVAIVILDGVTMYFCVASLGVPSTLGVGFAAFMMGTIVSTLGPLPMGLGSFEAASTLTLRVMGVPFAAALSATLLFRGFTLWLPLIPGMIAAGQLHSHDEAKEGESQERESSTHSA